MLEIGSTKSRVKAYLPQAEYVVEGLVRPHGGGWFVCD